ncbi:MAG TPA: PilZ domain-containing protein [Thermoanaerobaculia bacterium]|nr:PilZ domain-containing protein [Thermoanaerobaculia bacterium]
MRTRFSSFFSSRMRGARVQLEADPRSSLRVAHSAAMTLPTASAAGAGDRNPRVAERASTPAGDRKRLQSVDADYWRALRQRLAGGRQEHSGTENRNKDRFRVWGTLALYRCEPGPLAGEHIGVVEDASPAGLFIAIPQPPPVGTLLRMRIYCQAGPQGISVVEASGTVRWCHLHEPRGAGVQILDFADGERGLQAWLALMLQRCPDIALVPPPPGVALPRPAAACRRTAGTGPSAGRNRPSWKARSRR